MRRSKLPISIQTFREIREIREDDYYYVDKTGFALRLIEEGKAYFISRPRRFGKSLFIDTLAELFEGNAALFRGPEADQRWDWSQRYPVIRLSFAEGVLRNRAELESLFAAIPSDWYRNNPIARYEGYYASVFYSHLAALGLDLVPEDASHHGRLDLRLRFNGQLWLFEFKVVELAPEGAALEQIKARGYADKYRAEGLPIHLIGIDFSREQRTLVGFEVETLTP